LNESSGELYGYGWAVWWDFSDEPERGCSFVSLKAQELEQGDLLNGLSNILRSNSIFVNNVIIKITCFARPNYAYTVKQGWRTFAML
jgi:hypothetical protein